MDCRNAADMRTADGIVSRCKVLGVGKVKRAVRVCTHFAPIPS